MGKIDSIFYALNLVERKGSQNEIKLQLRNGDWCQVHTFSGQIIKTRFNGITSLRSEFR